MKSVHGSWLRVVLGLGSFAVLGAGCGSENAAGNTNGADEPLADNASECNAPASFKVQGRIVDVVKKEVFCGEVKVKDGKIKDIKHEKCRSEHKEYIMPGLVDAHVHIESSMVIPSEFARMAVPHGTVATVSDPHEIANVLGVAGVKYMIENGRKVPFKFNFGASPCVPATSFETAGAVLGVDAMEELLAMPEVKYMSEMMNFPGVLFNDPEVAAKLQVAKKYGKVIDGHAPLLSGADLQKYIAAGPSTDHESLTIGEAREKIQGGMKILIREGSASKDFETFAPLMNESPDQTMLCSDDKHPNDLVQGHINQLLQRAVAKGIPAMNAIRAATFVPVKHYSLNVGLLQEGDPADFVVVNNLTEFKVKETFVGGQLVAKNGKTLIKSVSSTTPNNFGRVTPTTAADFAIPAVGTQIRVIGAIDGQLITDSIVAPATIVDGKAVADPSRDILKITVVNRYAETAPAVAFISGFGLKNGAIAASVAHDSHNIVAVGTSDEALRDAVNIIIQNKGGLAVVSTAGNNAMPFPVAGLMSNADGYSVASTYISLDQQAKGTGSTLTSPFMTLSFMPLLVIPHLKLSDKGLFNGDTFSFTSVFVN